MTEVVPEGCLWDLGEPTIVDSDAAPSDVASDVLIVGAGFTGLWTAYYLRVLAPHLSITILEKHRIDDLVVVDSANRPIGMIDTQDLARFRLV